MAEDRVGIHFLLLLVSTRVQVQIPFRIRSPTLLHHTTTTNAFVHKVRASKWASFRVLTKFTVLQKYHSVVPVVQ